MAAPPPSTPAAVATRKPRSRARRVATWSLATVLALLIVVVAALLFALQTTTGESLLLQRIAMLTGGIVSIEEPSGEIRGDFAARRVRIATAASTIDIEGLRYSLQSYQLRPLQLRFKILHADRVHIAPVADAPKSPPPSDLKLPADIAVEALSIGALTVGGSVDKPARTIEGIAATLDLTQVEHSITLTSASIEQLKLAANLKVGAAAPMPLSGSLNAATAADAMTPSTPVDFKATLGGTVDAIDVDARLLAQNQAVAARAVVRPFATAPLSTLNARMANFDASSLLASLPKTDVTGEAVIAIERAPYRIDIKASNALPGRADQARLPVAAITAVAQGDGQRWRIERAVLALASGPAAADAAGELRAAGDWAGGQWNTTLDFDKVRFDGLLASSPALRVDGAIKLAGRGTDFKQPIAVDGRIVATPVSGSARTPALPRALAAGATIEAKGTISPERIEFASFSARAGETRAQGKLALGKNRARWIGDATLTASGLDPEQWSARAERATATAKRPTTALEARGVVHVELPVNDLRRIEVATAELAITGGGWRGSAITGQAKARLVQPYVGGAALPLVASDGQLTVAANKLQWQGAIGGANDVLKWSVEAPDLSLVDATLAGKAQGSGALSGGWSALATDFAVRASDLRYGETLAASAEATGNVVFKADAPLKVDVALQRLRARPSATRPGGGTNAGPVTPALPVGNTEATQGGAETTVVATARGSLRQHDVELTVNVAQGTRRFATKARLRGEMQLEQNQPRGWSGSSDAIRVEELSAAGAATTVWAVVEPLRARWQRDASGSRTIIDAGAASIIDVPIRWSTITLDATGSGDAPLVKGDIGPFNAVAVARRLGRDGLFGDLQLGGSFSVRAMPEPAAELRLARMGGDLRSADGAEATALGLRSMNASAVLDGGRWRLNYLLEGAQVGRAQLNAEVSALPQSFAPDTDAPLSGRIDAEVRNIAAWNALLPTGWRIAGRLTGQAQLAGTLRAPTARGELALDDFAIRNVIEGVDIKQGSGRAVLAGDAIEITRFSAQAGEGTLRATGKGPLAAPFAITANVTMERFAAINRADRSVSLSGDAILSVTAKEVALTGKITVDRGRIDITRLDTPKLSDDVVVIRKSQPPATPTQRSAPPNLNLVVDLGNDFQLRGRGLETFLRGQLTFTSPQGMLNATGNIRTQGGTYRAYAQRLLIDRGVVSFAGPIDRPRLDILALKPNFGDEVGVSITGSVQQPRIKLYSNPVRSETDTLALLMLGRNFDELGRDDTALVQQAALALLSGEDGGIAQKFGLDNLSLRQGSGETKQTIVTVGKQLSERLYVGYEQGVASTLGTIELIYRISPRFTLRAQAGADTALDGIFTLRWR